MIISVIYANRSGIGLNGGGEGLGADESIFGVPGVGETAAGKEVTVKVVGELFGVLREEEGAGFGENEVVGVGVVGVSWEDGGDGEGVEDGADCVVDVVAAKEEGGNLQSGVVVDGDEGVRVANATDGGVAGNGAGSVLVEGVGSVGGGELFAVVVVFGGGGAVANWVVGVVEGEAGNLGVVVGEGAAGGGDFGTGVVAVVVLDRGVVEGSGAGNGGAPAEGVVGVVVAGQEGGVVVGLDGSEEVAKKKQLPIKKMEVPKFHGNRIHLSNGVGQVRTYRNKNTDMKG